MSICPVASNDRLTYLANASNEELSNLAYYNARSSKKVKNCRRKSNALIYSIPVAMGLNAVIANPSTKGSILHNNLKTFGKNAGYMFGAFATIDLAAWAYRKVIGSNEKIKNFMQEHTITNTLALIGTTIGALILGNKGLHKLPSLLNKYIPKSVGIKMSSVEDRILTGITNSKTIKTVADWAKKLPSSVKTGAKIGLSWAPMMLLAGSFLETIKGENITNKKARDNYEALKINQAMIRKAIASKDPDGVEEQS